MSIKAMQQALDSLDEIRILLWKESRVFSHVHSSIDSLRIAIEDEKRRLLSTPEPKQDEEPVAWMFFSSKGRPHYHLNEYQALEGLKMYGGSKVIALYEHPAPRKPFVRLSEEECISIHRKWVDSGRSISRFARAIEDALEEKNK